MSFLQKVFNPDVRLIFIRSFTVYKEMKQSDKQNAADSCKNCIESRSKYVSALPCLRAEDPQSLDRSNVIPKVIIVGGGIAGLSAAHHLIKHGCECLVVLEASDRVGGRILTGWMGDTTMDMGPNVISGGSILNPLFNMAITEGLFKTTKISRLHLDKAHYLTTDTRIIEDHGVVKNVFQKIIQQYSRKSGECSYSKVSLQDFVPVRIQQELLNFPEKMRYDVEKLLFGMLNELKVTTGADLDKLSAGHFAADKKLPGGNIKMPQGFCTILAKLMRDIPQGSLELNKRVKAIEWSNDGEPRVMVTTDDDYDYAANFAIVALPLGILKANIKSMFRPKLSELKINAIKDLGVGHIIRVYLEYVTPWWTSEQLLMKIAWSPRELREWKSWTRSIGVIQGVNNSNRVIMFTVGGSDAIELENYTEVEIAIEFTKFLRKLIGDSTIQYPNNVAISRWSCNPNFLGGSVYLPTGADISTIKHLYMPDDDCNDPQFTPPILFAGEATHDKFFGTVHGAAMSGVREAEKVLKYAKCKKVQTCTSESINEIKSATC